MDRESQPMNQRVLLIVPCHNEEKRLNVDVFIRETPSNVDLMFANDGSTDKTLEVIGQICASRPEFRVYSAAVNRGKAGVIQGAFREVEKLNLLESYDWLGFWDADLATPLSEINNFLKYQSEFSPHSKALIGCRLARYGAQISRSPLRHYLSRVFVTFTDVLLGIKAYDSQCGAKLFHRSIAQAALGPKFISKWIFDLEIILRVGSANVLEIPVFRWAEIPGSKMRIGRESFRVLGDLMRIRSHYKKEILGSRSGKNNVTSSS